eukprot:1194351-Prorocentrum_minimum.AAC.1
MPPSPTRRPGEHRPLRRSVSFVCIDITINTNDSFGRNSVGRTDAAAVDGRRRHGQRTRGRVRDVVAEPDEQALDEVVLRLAALLRVDTEARVHALAANVLHGHHRAHPR